MAKTMMYPEEKRPTIIGLYGLPGSGKSHLLGALEQVLGTGHFFFFEGSEVVAKFVPGGLEAFKQLPDRQKVIAREEAISSISADCLREGKAGVVTGHFMFWTEGHAQGTSVWTKSDLETYTHIVYLDVDPEIIHERSRIDLARNRTASSTDHLQRWRLAEKKELRGICYENHILFLVLDSKCANAQELATKLKYFRLYSQDRNLHEAKKKLDEAIKARGWPIGSMVVLDADKTMAAEDTGTLFWNFVTPHGPSAADESPLKSIFGSSLGYSHMAFRQAALLYEGFTPSEFHGICGVIAARIMLYADIVSLLQTISNEQHAGAVVVTCGPRLVWQKILQKAGFGEKVKVIGSGHIKHDDVVVDADMKAKLVTHLRQCYGMFVTAFGDSVLDLPMMAKANRAVVVVGDEQSRSKSMGPALARWINEKGLRPRQALLAPTSTLLLDDKILPLVCLTDSSFADDIFLHRHEISGLEVNLLTDTNAAKVLMTPMRDAMNGGPSLRSAHHTTGWYLALNALVETVGVEDYEVTHVQDKPTTGYRLRSAQRTLIVALMRGGEPMALGINEAFPLASFLHAKKPDEVTFEHLVETETVMLVDSVVNNGQTMMDFTQHVHDLVPAVRIIMVAGVIQAQAITRLQDFQVSLRHRHIGLVALRKSDNKYTVTGSTDTGNRLFNTVHLE